MGVLNTKVPLIKNVRSTSIPLKELFKKRSLSENIRKGFGFFKRSIKLNLIAMRSFDNLIIKEVQGSKRLLALKDKVLPYVPSCAVP